MPFPIGRQLAFLLARRRSWERRGPRSVSASQQRAAGSNASRGQRPPACPLLSAGRPGSRLRLRHSPASAVTCASLSTSSASSMASKEFNPTFPTTDWSVAKKHLKELDHTERRSYYKAERFVILDEIQTWKDFSTEEKLKQPVTHYKKNDVLNEKVSLLQEDITKLEIDAIVNAANSSLMGGGGDVIHTVGPIVQGKERLPEKVLQSCYVTSLKLASDNNLRTIAFPCVSTGIYGYPNGQAAETVLKTVRQYLEEHRNSFDRIIFCVFLKIDYMLYKEKMPFYFPFDAVSPGSPKEKSKSADKDEKQTENTLKLGNGQGAK
ncbi:ADP-ribose glycohydrolase MACROD1-like isoform X3 [Pristis pectinata]|uniref:ADP-ribose glycohydrolase MACROD1-like isoform X3 n=1 Tax=Pristis pectinata TaxID=685728 RepID=UPI00223D5A7E|nr:ADP-ribose glycohydrolase MACROD1-like isoform X3 [Pristis pectinata]